MKNPDRLTKPWRLWLGILSSLALSVALGIGWWLDHQGQAMEAEALRAKFDRISSQSVSENPIGSQSDDLIRFIDEAYALLQEEGIHVKLDLEVDEKGHYRLRADSVELMDDLKAKLRERDE